jgi:hypothetical protein
MATVYSIQQFIQPENSPGLLFCDTKYSVTLGANTATALTVPGSGGIGLNASTTYNKFVALFRYSQPISTETDVFVSNGGTAAVPAGSSFASTTSDQNPAGYIVKAGDVLSFITAATGVSVTVCFYSYID